MDPIPAWMRRLWDDWDVRVLVLLSLIFQIILYIFGQRRKYIVSSWIRIIVWLAYLVSDAVASLALSKLADAELDSDNNTDLNKTLRLIWTPLLLLHLGGPDTITAYSSEDNQLWLRHLLAFVVKLSMAIYVFMMMTWRGSWFSFLTVPVFVAAIIKCGERIWALKAASNEEAQKVPLPLGLISCCPVEFDAEPLVMAYQIYTACMPHIAYYMCDLKAVLQGPQLLRPDGSSEDYMKYWEAMEIEMGMMFDLNYTKVPITYTKTGRILRLISLFCTSSALLGFFLVFSLAELHGRYLIVDIAITGMLLVGALCLEIYAIYLVITSDWARLWLIKHHQNQVVSWFLKKFPWLISTRNGNRRWSGSVGQMSLLDISNLRKPKMLSGILGWLGIEEMFDYYIIKSHANIPGDLKGKIMEFAVRNRESIGKSGSRALQIHNCEEELRWTTTDVHFCGRILLWHTATEICYLKSDPVRIQNSSVQTEMKASKLLSNYMMYVVAMCSFLLPGSTTPPDEQQTSSLARDTEISKERILIQFLETKGEEKWKILESVWVEILCDAALRCHQDIPSQLLQLRRGGELLTLIWLFLMRTKLEIGARNVAEFLRLGGLLNLL